MSLIRRVRSHLASPDSSHGKIAKGFFWVSLFLLIGKLAGAGKEMVIAWRYGIGDDVDAYLYVLNLVNWPVAVSMGVLTSVLIPLAARARVEMPGALAGFRAELLGGTLLGGVLLLALAWWGGPLVLASPWSGLTETARGLALEMFPVMVWLLPLGILTSLLSVWMLTSARHSNTLLEGVPALVVLSALLLFPMGGIAPLVWGSLLGVSLHVCALFAASFSDKWPWPPRLNRRSPLWASFLPGLVLVLVGQAVMSLSTLVDQFFAAHLGEGAVATMSYANRVLGLILSLFAVAVARATMPVFSGAYQQDRSATRRVVQRWALWSLLVGCGAVLLCWALAPWLIELLFERGRFSRENTKAVAELFRYGLLQLPFYAAGLIYVSSLTSQRRYGVILSLGIFNLGVKIGAAWVLVPWLGLGGLMLSTGFMLMTSLFLLMVSDQNVKRSSL